MLFHYFLNSLDSELERSKEVRSVFGQKLKSSMQMFSAIN